MEKFVDYVWVFSCPMWDDVTQVTQLPQPDPAPPPAAKFKKMYRFAALAVRAVFLVA